MEFDCRAMLRGIDRKRGVEEHFTHRLGPYHRKDTHQVGKRARGSSGLKTWPSNVA